VLIFRFDNLDEAIRILRDNKVRVIKGDKLYAM
jgi:hypothetical protein